MKFSKGAVLFTEMKGYVASNSIKFEEIIEKVSND